GLEGEAGAGVLARLSGAEAEGALALAEDGDGPVRVALLAHVEAAAEREVGRVDDGVVHGVGGLGVDEAGLDVEGAGPVALLAADAVFEVGVGAVEVGDGLGGPVVAGHAAVGDGAAEAAVGLGVAGAEVPPPAPAGGLRVPRQRELVEAVALPRE